MGEKLWHYKAYKQGQTPERNLHLKEEQMVEFKKEFWYDLVIGMKKQSYLKFWTSDPLGLSYEIKRVN
jgi:hypothetical protein